MHFLLRSNYILNNRFKFYRIFIINCTSNDRKELEIIYLLLPSTLYTKYSEFLVKVMKISIIWSRASLLYEKEKFYGV